MVQNLKKSEFGKALTNDVEDRKPTAVKAVFTQQRRDRERQYVADLRTCRADTGICILKFN
jgi:hypothetical protein